MRSKEEREKETEKYGSPWVMCRIVLVGLGVD